MKIISKLILLCFIIVFVVGNYIYALGGEKLRIAVMNLKAEGVSQVEANAVSEFLRNDLIDTNVFEVVERSNMEQVLVEQGFQHMGCTDRDCAVKLGNILNVQKIIVGSLIKLGDEYYISIRYVNIESGLIEKSVRRRCEEVKELIDKSSAIAIVLSESTTGIMKRINELRNKSGMTDNLIKESILEDFPELTEQINDIFEGKELLKGKTEKELEALREKAYKKEHELLAEIDKLRIDTDKEKDEIKTLQDKMSEREQELLSEINRLKKRKESKEKKDAKDIYGKRFSELSESEEMKFIANYLNWKKSIKISSKELLWGGILGVFSIGTGLYIALDNKDDVVQALLGGGMVACGSFIIEYLFRKRADIKKQNVWEISIKKKNEDIMLVYNVYWK